MSANKAKLLITIFAVFFEIITIAAMIKSGDDWYVIMFFTAYFVVGIPFMLIGLWSFKGMEYFRPPTHNYYGERYSDEYIAESQKAFDERWGKS